MRKFLIVVMSLMMLTTTACSNPFKVTDPSDPKFNPDKFRFIDYKTPDEMRSAFRKLFPIGTDREFVDRVLVKAGGAVIVTEKKSDTKNLMFSFVRYSENFNPFRQFKTNPFYTFLYNDANKIINITVWNGSYLYKDSPTMENLNGMKGKDHE